MTGIDYNMVAPYYMFKCCSSRLKGSNIFNRLFSDHHIISSTKIWTTGSRVLIFQDICCIDSKFRGGGLSDYISSCPRTVT